MNNLIKDNNISNFRNKIIAILVIICSIIYSICPVDFIPDLAPVIGWLDDIFFIICAIINIYVQWKKKTSTK